MQDISRVRERWLCEVMVTKIPLFMVLELPWYPSRKLTGKNNTQGTRLRSIGPFRGYPRKDRRQFFMHDNFTSNRSEGCMIVTNWPIEI